MPKFQIITVHEVVAESEREAYVKLAKYDSDCCERMVIEMKPKGQREVECIDVQTTLCARKES